MSLLRRRAPAATVLDDWQATTLLVAAGAVVLLLPALMNGFPFVFDDSADYLVFTPRLYRSPFYGLTIFFFHLNTYIWLAVAFQAVVLSHIIWLWVRILMPAHRERTFLACIVLLTLFSSLPFMAGFLMADAFTAVMVLSIGLLAFHLERLNRMEQVYVFLLSCLSIVSHVSHLAISVALVLTIVLLYALQRRSFRSLRLRLLLLAGSVALSVIAIFLNNAVVHRVPALSPAGPSFLLANLIEYGPARRYLEGACPQAAHKICAHLSEMPDTAFLMLWKTDFYARLGGFKGMRDEAGQIVAETIRTRPGEVTLLAARLVLGAFLARAPGADLKPVGNTYWLENTLEKRFGPATLKAYLASAQHNNNVPRNLLRKIDLAVFPVSFLFMLGIVIVSARRSKQQELELSVLVLSGFLANTVLCAIASGVFERYQARVTWLVPFATLLLLARMAIPDAPRSRNYVKVAGQLPQV